MILWVRYLSYYRILGNLSAVLTGIHVDFVEGILRESSDSKFISPDILLTVLEYKILWYLLKCIMDYNVRRTPWHLLYNNLTHTT